MDIYRALRLQEINIVYEWSSPSSHLIIKWWLFPANGCQLIAFDVSMKVLWPNVLQKTDFVSLKNIWIYMDDAEIWILFLPWNLDFSWFTLKRILLNQQINIHHKISIICNTGKYERKFPVFIIRKILNFKWMITGVQ